jgi:hypothetical protein
MRRFIKNCFLFLVCFFILEKSFILLRNNLPERELDKRLEYVINGKINADIVVIGSSRGARDIVASQLAESLGATAYNLSYPGSNIYFHEYLLTNLVKNGNKKPKLIILAVDDPYEVGNDPTIQFRLDRLYPLVKYKCIRNTLIEHGEKNRGLSGLFVVHQLSVSSFDIRKKKFTYQDTLFNDGSMPISWQSERFDRRFNTKVSVYSKDKEEQSKVKSFDNFLTTCRNNNIELLLVCAPNFSNPTAGFRQRMMELAGSDNHIMQYDTANPVYTNPDYYYDASHLKLDGATIFTAEIATCIKQNKLLNR